MILAANSVTRAVHDPALTNPGHHGTQLAAHHLDGMLGTYPAHGLHGRPFIALFLGVAIVLQVLTNSWWALPFYLLFLFSLQFFRSPMATKGWAPSGK